MTGSRRGRPRAEEAPASLDEILTKALKMFSERGFDGTSVAELNRELGVSHNLIHQRFGSKAGLWQSAVDRAFGQIRTHMTADLEVADGDLLEVARETIKRFLLLHATHPEVLRLVTVEGGYDSPRLKYLYDNHIGPTIQLVTAPTKVLVDRGVLTSADIRSLHFLVAHGASAPFSLAPLAQLIEPSDPLAPEAVRAHAVFVANLVVDGLRARGA